MKRSEMVEKIAEAILAYDNLYGGDPNEREEAREATKMSRLMMANAALECCEQNGMIYIKKQPIKMDKGNDFYLNQQWDNKDE